MIRLFLFGMLLSLVITGCTPDARSCFEVDGTYYEVNEPVMFLNCSSGANSFLWDFGDGNQSTELEPTHHYRQTGEYNVTLTASGKQSNEISRLKVQVIQPTILEIAVYFEGTAIKLDNCDVILYANQNDWSKDLNRIAAGRTDANGRIRFVSSSDGTYRLGPFEYYVYASKPDNSGNGHYSNKDLPNRTNQLIQNAVNTKDFFVKFYPNPERPINP